MAGDESKEILVRTHDFLDKENASGLAEFLRGERGEDIAAILQDLSDEDKVSVFDLLEIEKAALVLDETDPASKELLAEEADVSRLSDMLHVMPPDEAADILDLLPEEERAEILRSFPPDEAEELRELDAYDRETAGGIMTTDFVAIPESANAGDAMRIVQGAVDAEHIHSLFVIGESEELRGVVGIRSLISAASETPVSDIMSDEVFSANLNDDQEDVARLADKYNLSAVPVIDDANSLKGIITVDDLVDTIREEVSEDMFRLAGTAAHHPIQEKVFKRVFLRLPWLITTMVGGVVAMMILSNFQTTLDKIVALAFFIPVTLGMAGNVGQQSSTIMVRGLAIGEVEFSKLFRVLSSELAVGGLIAIICGTIIAFVAAASEGPALLGIVVGSAMCCGITVAALVGTVVPLVCDRIGIDPALAAGPFVSTLNDVLGVIIYLTIATSLMVRL